MKQDKLALLIRGLLFSSGSPDKLDTTLLEVDAGLGIPRCSVYLLECQWDRTYGPRPMSPLRLVPSVAFVPIALTDRAISD